MSIRLPRLSIPRVVGTCALTLSVVLQTGIASSRAPHIPHATSFAGTAAYDAFSFGQNLSTLLRTASATGWRCGPVTSGYSGPNDGSVRCTGRYDAFPATLTLYLEEAEFAELELTFDVSGYLERVTRPGPTQIEEKADVFLELWWEFRDKVDAKYGHPHVNESDEFNWFFADRRVQIKTQRWSTITFRVSDLSGAKRRAAAKKAREKRRAEEIQKRTRRPTTPNPF